MWIFLSIDNPNNPNVLAVEPDDREQAEKGV